ncbi:hypothetical protein PseudUWO311_17160 [Pseudanabaena sp. UWO311]|uniref:hypothetical protein n=1 Tax=Pseudanabaena sp. UWO311 TaxID=2487337 RepID=UPI0011598688|nr:hypothetical protein [Pseudanabaena sp. UWO311]TYQ24893.1 hypothetical protein PseudUWO311_17160 [Pseudanabaena sp. UWO311]
MKKIFLSILASTISFVGIAPVFAGSFTIQTGCQTSSIAILRNTPPVRQSNLLSINISQAIAALLGAAGGNANISNLVVLLSNGNGNSASVTSAQIALNSLFAGLGINVAAGSSAANLIDALTGLVPGNFNAGSGQLQTVDLNKLSQAILAFNQIVNELADIAKGSDPEAARAQAILSALAADSTFTTLSTTLAAISKDLP